MIPTDDPILVAVVPTLRLQLCPCDADDDLLFGDDHEHKWSMALAKMGVGAEVLSPETGRA